MRLSNCGDQSVRNHLHDTANVILTRPTCNARLAPPEFAPAGGSRCGALADPACIRVRFPPYAGSAMSGTVAPASRNARAAPGWKASTWLAPAFAARVPAPIAPISRAGSMVERMARVSA